MADHLAMDVPPGSTIFEPRRWSGLVIHEVRLESGRPDEPWHTVAVLDTDDGEIRVSPDARLTVRTPVERRIIATRAWYAYNEGEDP